MKPNTSRITTQRGASLFVSLIILALLTILATTTLSGSMSELKIARNNQQTIDSLQKTDAGIDATMSLVNTDYHPFNGADNANPFANVASADNPLSNISDVTVAITLQQTAAPCPRIENASSANQIACEYYEIRSQYAPVNSGITTTLREGVRRQIIAH